MRNAISILFTVLICLGLPGLPGCRPGGESGSPDDTREVLGKDASYALGMSIGADFNGAIFIPDIVELSRGIADVLNDSPTRISMDDIEEVFYADFRAIQERYQTAVIQIEIDYLEENSRKPGILNTASGLQYEVIRQGSGEKPSFDDMVLVHYTGALADGFVFHSSHDQGEPEELNLSWVIPGWAEGLQLMSIGSIYRFYIPSALGYGAEGRNTIPPYATLVFDVELLDILQNDE